MCRRPYGEALTPTDLGSEGAFTVRWRKKMKNGLTGGNAAVTLRCVLDGLLLYATLCSEPPILLAFDGDEPFQLEAIEALYYEIVAATREELLALERACYRLLRRAGDFRQVEDDDASAKHR